MEPALSELSNIVDRCDVGPFALGPNHQEWHRVKGLIQRINSDSDLDEQVLAFGLAMKSFPLFDLWLSGDLSEIPALLRHALMSRALYEFGSTACPEELENYWKTSSAKVQKCGPGTPHLKLRGLFTTCATKSL